MSQQLPCMDRDDEERLENEPRKKKRRWCVTAGTAVH